MGGVYVSIRGVHISIRGCPPTAVLIIYRLIKERYYVLTKGVAVSDVTNAFFYEVY